jgi:hypothetical protein
MNFIHNILFILSLIVSNSIASDNTSSIITQSQSISDGEIIVSPNRLFEFGLFSIKNPNKRYLGIRFKNIPTQNAVWVANGGKPINDSSAVLKLNSSGSLVLTHNNNVVWFTNSSTKAQKPVAQLLDNGNLVIKEDSVSETYLWQSFDYPSNTLLAGIVKLMQILYYSIMPLTLCLCIPIIKMLSFYLGFCSDKQLNFFLPF